MDSGTMQTMVVTIALVVIAIIVIAVVAHFVMKAARKLAKGTVVIIFIAAVIVLLYFLVIQPFVQSRSDTTSSPSVSPSSTQTQSADRVSTSAANLDGWWQRKGSSANPDCYRFEGSSVSYYQYENNAYDVQWTVDFTVERVGEDYFISLDNGDTYWKDADNQNTLERNNRNRTSFSLSDSYEKRATSPIASSATKTVVTVTAKAADGETLTGTIRRDSNDYVLADSSWHEYTEEELLALNLNDAELAIAWNEIAARLGYHWDNTGLRTYFKGCSWYKDIAEPGTDSDTWYPQPAEGSVGAKNGLLMWNMAISSNNPWISLALE